MTRAATVYAEIAGSIDNAGSEVMMPDAIDDHSSCQWIACIGEPVGQRLSTLFLGIS